MLVVASADPLIILAQAGALDALLRPGMPVVIPDMVRFEVVRDPNRPGNRTEKPHRNGCCQVNVVKISEFLGAQK
jgi:hypothetical protein